MSRMIMTVRRVTQMNNMYTKKAETLLKDLDLYRNSIEYYSAIKDCAELNLRQLKEIDKKEKYLRRTVSATEHAMTFLDDTEREILTRLYINKDMAVDDLCELCALERSSIYRYRSSGLRKIAKAVYGEE